MNDAPLLTQAMAYLNQPCACEQNLTAFECSRKRASLKWNDVPHFWKLNIEQLLEETICFVPKFFCKGPNIELLGANILGTLGDALRELEIYLLHTHRSHRRRVECLIVKKY